MRFYFEILWNSNTQTKKVSWKGKEQVTADITLKTLCFEGFYCFFLHCWCGNLRMMRHRGREKTSYQLQATQEDQRASCRAAPHPLLSAPAGSAGEEVQKRTTEENGSNTRSEPAELHYQMWGEKRTVCTSPHKENTYGLSLWGNYRGWGRGGGCMRRY